ncbi:MAG: hypothetical protein NTX59_11140 [Elusimicrobia bacterium]|nr:hypothetical protein [Elusimicrobiota bacterium]
MHRNCTPALKTEAEDDAIEPEIVSSPSRGAHGGQKAGSAMSRFRAFIFKLKLLFAGVIGLVALALIITGAVLTSTVIGAILGIPLMLVGVLLIWLLLNALTFGETKKFFVSRRF